MSKTTDRQILDRALELLEENLLPSILPGRLQIEFALTRDRAARLASEALQQRREKTK